MQAKQYATKQHRRNKKYRETYENESMMIQNLCNTPKTDLRENFIATQSYIRK